MAEETNDVRKTSAKRTRRSFLFGGLAAAAGVSGLTWLARAANEDGIPWPLRRILEWNERLAGAAFRDGRLAPTFPASAAASAEATRVNGLIGLQAEVDARDWRLVVESDAGVSRSFTLAELRALPRTTMVTELKCIEGWSQVISWTGVALRDFMSHYALGTRTGRAPDFTNDRDAIHRYVALETPDRAYYVGLDRDSAVHPQTLLCYEMGGQPLSTGHGAPLRLAIPVKYGIKNIKRIGRIRFTDRRPADYWAERGYDWYAGH
jgi:DMSO/TMAO reductase YedYZ molybdopterin-dependent catalytic subunit